MALDVERQEVAAQRRERRGLGAHHRAGRERRVAGGQRMRRALDLDQAEPAGSFRREPVDVAQRRDVDPEPPRGGQDRLAVADLDGSAVDPRRVAHAPDLRCALRLVAALEQRAQRTRQRAVRTRTGSPAPSRRTDAAARCARGASRSPAASASARARAERARRAAAARLVAHEAQPVAEQRGEVRALAAPRRVRRVRAGCRARPSRRSRPARPTRRAAATLPIGPPSSTADERGAARLLDHRCAAASRTRPRRGPAARSRR